jgi:ABC-2 type transport system permease protein
VTGALAYLTLRSAANRTRRQLARLRNPRYLVALAVGLAWLWALFLWQRPRTPLLGTEAAGTVELLGALVLFALVAWGWFRGTGGSLLAFTPAEITLLFPAPLTRRTVVLYKILRGQLRIVVSTLVWTLLFAREQVGFSPLLQAVSLWTILSTLTLHRLGAALLLTSLAEHGRFALRRRALSLGVAALVLLAVAWTVGTSFRPLPGGAGGPFAALERAAAHPIAATILWPFRLLARPLAATGPDAWRAAIGPALALLALHFVWVVRSDAAFEEAAAAASLARARRLSARPTGARSLRAGRRVSPPLLPLGATGWPGTALLWKNVTAVVRRRRAGTVGLGFVAAAVALGALGIGRPDSLLTQVAGALALVWSGFLLLLGPQWVRNDLRTDLRSLDLLRSYPLAGWAVVAAEVAASTLTLTVLQLGVLFLAHVSLLRDPSLGLGVLERWVALGAAVVVLPVLNFMAMLLQNGGAVLYPGWVRLGPGGGGIEGLGQNLLATLASAALLLVTLAPPVALGLMLVDTLRPATGAWALVPAVAAGLAVLGAEAAALVLWVGGVLERTDAL